MDQNRRQYDEQIHEVHTEVCEVKQEVCEVKQKVTKLEGRFDLREPQFLQLLEDVDNDRADLNEHITRQEESITRAIGTIEKVSKSVDNNTAQMASVVTTMETLHKETRQSVDMANKATGFWAVLTWMIKCAGAVVTIGTVVTAGTVYLVTKMQAMGVIG